MQDDDDKCDDDSDTVKKRVRPEGRQKKFLANTEFHWNLVSLSHQNYDFNYLMTPFTFTGKLAPEKLIACNIFFVLNFIQTQQQINCLTSSTCTLHFTCVKMIQFLGSLAQ
jgi:hypothetical protein